METTNYSFSNFSRKNLKRILGLQRVLQHPLMSDWISKGKPYEASDIEQFLLTKWQNKLALKSDTWNEMELQLQFIGPLLSLIDFDSEEGEVSAFAERILEKEINNVLLQGKVDWMVAVGDVDPEQPFFFIHEYKRGLKGNGDPVGQLVATMCVAQKLNEEPSKPTLFNPTPVSYKDLPIYGCYVVGRYWYFVILKDVVYYISPSYDATKTIDLYEIVKLLKAQKQMIIDRVTKNQ